MARTTKTAIVICESGPGVYSYRAQRMSDGANLDLADAVRSSGGFDVTNPANGVRYEVRSNQVSIVEPDGRTAVEPVDQYASS